MSDPDTWHFLPNDNFGFEGMAHPVRNNARASKVIVFICCNYTLILRKVKKINMVTKKEDNMFISLGLIIGFAAGWYANEKWDDLKALGAKAMFWKK